jgi:hypothetical protein
VYGGFKPIYPKKQYGGYGGGYEAHSYQKPSYGGDTYEVYKPQPYKPAYKPHKQTYNVISYNKPEPYDSDVSSEGYSDDGGYDY